MALRETCVRCRSTGKEKIAPQLCAKATTFDAKLTIRIDDLRHENEKALWEKVRGKLSNQRNGNTSMTRDQSRIKICRVGEGGSFVEMNGAFRATCGLYELQALSRD